jgi:hypothetical protein
VRFEVQRRDSRSSIDETESKLIRWAKHESGQTRQDPNTSDRKERFDLSEVQFHAWQNVGGKSHRFHFWGPFLRTPYFLCTFSFVLQVTSPTEHVDKRCATHLPLRIHSPTYRMSGQNSTVCRFTDAVEGSVRAINVPGDSSFFRVKGLSGGVMIVSTLPLRISPNSYAVVLDGDYSVSCFED